MPWRQKDEDTSPGCTLAVIKITGFESSEPCLLFFVASYLLSEMVNK